MNSSKSPSGPLRKRNWRKIGEHQRSFCVLLFQEHSSLVEDSQKRALVVQLVLLSVDLYGVTTELREENSVTLLDGRLPVRIGSSHGNHLAFVHLPSDLLGNQDAGLGLLSSLVALNEHAVAEGSELLVEDAGAAEHSGWRVGSGATKMKETNETWRTQNQLEKY